MTTRIKILPEELCNKIAAGEVVERPSSVVKELLENAIDAGAGSIEIALEAGGKRLIRVTDDGCGMGRQDALLAFERHATSKISSDADLFALTTLGFRGEALASIASVARLKLLTCDNNDGVGHEVYAEGGQVRRVSELGRPQGTEIEVRNLFFNLPARKKFLRKEQTELGHAADVVTKQALAHPQIAFRLTHNDRVLLDLRREKGVRERVAALIGRSLLKDLLDVDAQAGDDLRLSGLISQPQLSRSTAGHIYTFINGRYIRDRVVQHAVMEGYRHLLMKGRYPVAVLFLQMDPAQVDVNVHPTKHEVRFREQALVHDFIADSLKKILSPAQWTTAPEEIATVLESDRSGAPSAAAGGAASASPSAATLAAYPSENSASARVADALAGYRARVSPSLPVSASAPFSFERPASPSAASSDAARADSQQYVLPAAEADGFFSGLQILGQYHRCYILCQDGDDLILIDQHAAHERVRFEALRHSYADGAIASQTLLFPEILELDFNSAAALEENLEELQRLGFEVEPFGGKSYALKAVPQLLGQGSSSRLLTDVALELERVGRTGQLRDSIDEVLILMSCHGSVRANQSLSTAEIKALFRSMDQVDFNANCPHGRPVMQRLTLTEVERLFRRQ